MSRRELSGAPSLSIELAIVLGVAFAGIAVHALPGIHAWAAGAPATLESCRAETARVTELAARYAGVIAGCLNGGAITDGEFVAACREAR